MKEALRLSTKRLYEFDRFRVDPENRLLLRDSEVVALTPKVFDVLLVFIENQGKLVEKDELMERVWAGAFVEEGNVARAVSSLRKALGERQSGNSYIVTVSGRGYRFMAEVRQRQADAAPLLVEERTTANVVIEHEESKSAFADSLLAALGRLSARQKTLVSVTAVVLVAALSWVGWQSGRKESGKRFSALSPIPVARWKEAPGASLSESRFSPDGKMIAFASTQSGRGQALYVKQVGGGNAVRITHDEWINSSPVWSPDGLQIAFLSQRGEQTGIWAMPALAAPSR